MLVAGFLLRDSRWHPASRALFARAALEARPIRLVTATLTLDEVVFVLLEELVAQPPFSVPHSRSQYLAGHPHVVSELARAIDGPIQAVLGLVSLEPVLRADVVAMHREMAAVGLLPRDALHVAVMRRLGLTSIAS